MTMTANPPAANDGQRPSPRDLHARMGSLSIRDEWEKNGLSLSQWLEAEDPTPERYRDGTDAFTRQLACADIRTRTHPEGDYSAHPMSRWEEAGPQGRFLFGEWVQRQIRLARRQPGPQVRLPFFSSDTALNGALRPYADDNMPRVDITGPAIPISEIIARTRGVDSPDFRSIYLTRDAASSRKKRVAEGAEIPRAKMTTGEHTGRAHKYGIAIESTYEQARRISIDLFGFFIQQEAIQAETDEVVYALDLLVNGDGNSGTAATNYNLTTLDAAAVAGTLTAKGWITYKLKFPSPYMLTTVLMQEATGVQLLLLNMGSANMLLATQQASLGVGGVVPINNGLADGVRYGITSDAPSLKIVGFDRRYALGRVVENGSQIREQDKWITRQVNILTLSENVGYETILGEAVRTLDVNA